MNRTRASSPHECSSEGTLTTYTSPSIKKISLTWCKEVAGVHTIGTHLISYTNRDGGGIALVVALRLGCRSSSVAHGFACDENSNIAEVSSIHIEKAEGKREPTFSMPWFWKHIYPWTYHRGQVDKSGEWRSPPRICQPQNRRRCCQQQTAADFCSPTGVRF